ncbi:MAG TPA: 30S ribosomal protein S12 methylthiotransferase RimO [Syntrophorhabdaceae bacterium]|nr:30S ribosomal protein S12 methylthiotransferase RimO [Syntrophorhabdaceae bacterium]
MRFRIVSLGCPKNLVESEYMVGRLCSAGHTVSDDGDTIIVNTCAFIAEAARESIETILEAAREPGRKVVVTGCLVERYGEELAGLLPEVDAFVGRSRYGEIERVIGKSGLHLGKGGFSETFPRQVLTKPPTAYLKIQEGCDNRCRYCTIPAIRGGLTSRAEKDVIGEFRWLLDQGYREINVIGQDITSYGKDAGREQGLTGLIRSLLKEKGDWHLRLLYMHPKGITEGLIDVMGSDARVIPYLDVPIQHSEDRILSLMGRGHTRAYLEETLAMMRQRIPGAVLRTSIIVGFPTETEEEFEALLSFVRRHQFDMLGAFMYSREEGTAAYRMKGQIRKGVKRDRYTRLMETQVEISRTRLADLLGKTVKVIVEDVGASPKVGRMLTQAPDIDGVAFVNGACSEGDIRDGKVVKTLDYDVVVEV